MSTLIIRKKSLKTWLHTDSVLGDFIISKFYFNADNGNFQVVEQGQSRRVIYDVSDITLYDDTSGGSAETFANITALSLRLEALNYPAFQYDGQIVSIANLIQEGTNVTITGDGTEASPYVINSSGGGGGAVDSVNSQTGVVSIDLQSVLTEGNRPIKYINDFTPYEFIAEDKGKLLISGDGESMTLNADIFAEGDTLLIISEVSDIQLIAGVGVNIYGNLGVPSNHTLRIGEMAMLTHRAIGDFWWLNIVPQITSQTIPQTTSFTAEVDLRYTANGTLTVTDPTPIANKGFIVHVIGGSVTIGGVAYTSGALVYRYYDGASWISKNYNQDLQSVLTNGGTVIEGDNELYLNVIDGELDWSAVGSVSSPSFRATADQDIVIANVNNSTNKQAGVIIDTDGNLELIQKNATNTFGTGITITDPTANRSITFKDESGTVALLSDIENTQTNYTNNFLLGGM
jgi:hypothetical protein